ncbi:hypothetical protein GIY23_11140 [Allosaccharopolyspora coralli]|uniref:Gfo/Idh/MocA-like oxidoreductase N-terminal domain-containing protein n=2 Tax=Allosaccharopolyspora coralli TaxID=2665642 RepID=A0A5Q3Q860_9PSEU|nr:hypothetical protein GIY23_11140 [Allosaccharopolyspora coralli]
MQKNLLPFLQRGSRDYQPVVCVDPDAEQACYVQALTGAHATASTIEDVDLAAIDAAIVAVPPEPSAEIAEQLLQHRIHCFVEKPAGPSTPSLRRLSEVAGKMPDVHLQVGFNFRYAAALRQLHEATVSARESPCWLQIEFCSRHPSAPQWGVDTTVESWIRQNGVHAFDLAQWFIPSPVERVDGHSLPTSDPDRFLAVVGLHHADGSHSMLRVGNQTQRFQVNAAVHASDGSVYAAPSLESVVLSRDAGMPAGTQLFGQKPLDHGWDRSGFGPELEAFVATCLDRSSAQFPGITDALTGSQLCDQALSELKPSSASAATSVA